MRKTFIVVSTIAVLAIAPNLRAADSTDDAQLRDALRKKSGGQKAARAAQPAPAAKPAPVAKPAPAPAPAKAAPVEQPAAKPAAAFSTVPTTGGNGDALRAALRQQSGGSATTPAPKPTVAAKPAPEPAPMKETPKPVAVEQAVAKAAPVAPAAETYSSVPPSDADATALRAKLRQNLNEPAPPTVATTVPPLQAPASPVSASKEQKLADLLRLYKADVITPADYHKQRAAILAE